MKTLVHLSDLHFGRVDEAIVNPLIQTVNDIKPDVVAVSGDLTQRAQSSEFIAARAFLDQLPKPQIVVPGNHDVPLYNIFSRFFRPLDKYQRNITGDLRPSYLDEEIAVFGVNTARSLVFKGGRINESQVAWLKEKLCSLSPDLTTILVTHHPFDVPKDHDQDDLVGRAKMAIRELVRCGADMFLSGHLHISYTGHTAKRYNKSDRPALVVQAGTATSTRGRGEANSFNVIRVARPYVTIECREWQPGTGIFVVSSTERFRLERNGWIRLPDAD